MIKFSWLGNYRYEHTAFHNVGDTESVWGLSGTLIAPNMTTYQQLIDEHERRFAITALNSPESITESPGNQSQQSANLLSTLRGYLVFFGKTLLSPVGPELGGQFDASVRSYCDILTVSERTIRDRRSHLNRWREIADALRQEAHVARTRLKGVVAANFAERLRVAMTQTSVSLESLASATRVSENLLQSWLRGSPPSRKMRPAIRRIECVLNIPEGQLERFLPRQGAGHHDKKDAIVPSIAYRKSIAERNKSGYKMPSAQLSPALQHELQALYRYKTARRSPVGLQRHCRGLWKSYPSDSRPDTKPVPFDDTTSCPSFNLFVSLLRGVLGFLHLPRSRGGFGVRLEDCQTLAWLAVPDITDRFLDFLTTRSNGLVHGGQGQFVRTVLSLVHPESGYLAQQPNFSLALPVDFRPVDWSVSCAETRERMLAWKAECASGEKSRRPEIAINGLLNLAEPFAPVLRAVQQLDEMAHMCPEGGIQEAVNKRNALLLLMLVHNPLRARNYKLMKTVESVNGYVYRSGDTYRIRIPKSGFKNANSHQFDYYDVACLPLVSARLEDYLENYRPKLVGDTDDEGYLFVTDAGDFFQCLNTVVFQLTKKLIPETPGFSPHAFRNLVATVWLSRHPDDYLTVAELLNDRLETVIKSYAHLKKDTSLARHGELISGVWEGLSAA